MRILTLLTIFLWVTYLEIMSLSCWNWGSSKWTPWGPKSCPKLGIIEPSPNWNTIILFAFSGHLRTRAASRSSLHVLHTVLLSLFTTAAHCIYHESVELHDSRSLRRKKCLVGLLQFRVSKCIHWYVTQIQGLSGVQTQESKLRHPICAN